MIDKESVKKLSLLVAMNYCDACECHSKDEVAVALNELLGSTAAGVASCHGDTAAITMLEALIAGIKEAMAIKAETIQ